MLTRIISLLIGYLCGLFQTSYIIGRIQGIDIREYGSGNAGTTNALRTLGKKAGAFTLLFDCLKCMLAVFLVRLLFGSSHSEIISLLGLYASAGAILGHNFPFYLHFHGGKGIACTAGMIISLNLFMTLLGVITFFGNFFITHLVSLGSLLVYVGFVIEIIVMGQMGYFGMSQGARIEMYILAFALAVLAFYQHRANIVRLLNGTEKKTYLSKAK